MDFAEFYRATSPRTLRYAYGLTGDLAQAQDVVQEAYARAWQRWRRLSGYDDAEAWLRLVVSRLVFDWWRHLRVRRDSAQPAPGTVAGPSEDTVLVVAALKRIPERQRTALALHYLLDVPVAQIAADQGVSEGTVKSWLSRGRDSLAAVLKEELLSAALPEADQVVQRGRRRRRTRVVATVTAAGLAVLAVVVFATAILGRDRTMPPPPAVTPTGSPMDFSPLRKVGAVTLPATVTPDYGVIIQGGRAIVVSTGVGTVQLSAVDLATAKTAWPAATIAIADSDQSRMVAVPGVLAVMNGKEIVVVDAESGKPRWRMASAVEPHDIYFFPGVVVLADRITGEATGVDLVTGTPKWHLSTPIQTVFGMLDPADLALADRGFFPAAMNGNNSPQMFIADGRGQIAEYSATTGAATGRVWHGVPPNDGYLAYDGQIFIRSAREMYRLRLADGRQTLAYSGGGVVDMAPCGATDMCVIDATESGGKLVAAVHDDRVKWSVPFDNAQSLAPVGRAVRVSLDIINGDNVVLDEQGHEVLRLTGYGSIARLDAGNMLAYKMTLGSNSSLTVELIGVPLATIRQTPLGTVALTPGGGFAADGSTIVATVGHEIVVYRIG
jgi:RNA polymerase sigma-70 factor (sigma-E family)